MAPNRPAEPQKSARASSTRAKAPPEVRGDTLLYHYLEKGLQRSDVFLFQMLAARLVTDLGIWLHPSVYSAVPILLPYVVRDPSARRRGRDVDEMWAAPTDGGLLRDDNSLVKGIPRRLVIESDSNPLYVGKRLGEAPGWVAAHVWRSRVDGASASRHPDTNTFVPNLVWLPTAVAQLTDRPGSFVQRFAQALAHKIYNEQPLHEALRPWAERAWEALEIPSAVEMPPQALPSIESLNFFTPTESWLAGYERRIGDVVEALSRDEWHPDRSVRPRRYFEGLNRIPAHRLELLHSDLRHYCSAIANARLALTA